MCLLVWGHKARVLTSVGAQGVCAYWCAGARLGTGFSDENLKKLTDELKPHAIDAPKPFYRVAARQHSRLPPTLHASVLVM